MNSQCPTKARETSKALPEYDSYAWYLKIQEMWVSGHTKNQIIAELNCTRQTLNSTLRSCKCDPQGNYFGEKSPKGTRAKLLGNKMYWRRNLEIIKALLQRKLPRKVRLLHDISRQVMSKIRARARDAGFKIPGNPSAKLLGRECITFYRAAFMLSKGRTVPQVASQLKARLTLVQELNILVQEILVDKKTKG